MSFASPLVLIALLAIPAAVALYVSHLGRRRRAAAAFAAPQMTASVAPNRPGWRRHAPMVAFLVALGVLIVAAARPEHTVAVPVERASIMLMTDVSSSMKATDVAPDRLTAARRAAQSFADGVPAPVNIGVMAFNQTPSLLQGPTTDRAAVRAALDRMQASGNTASGNAIATGVRVLQSVPAENGRKAPAAIVLLSDGKSTSGVDPVVAARAAGKKKIPVYTVALGTPSGTVSVPLKNGGTVQRKVPPDPTALAEVARVSGGRAYTAETAGQLSQVYDDLGSQLGSEKQQRELTAGFAGGALVLLLAGCAMSLRWFGRPI